MESIVMALIMGLLGGPALAWAVRAPGSLKAYEKRKAKFAAGQGSDPDRQAIGPHKSFGHNAVIFGLIFGVIGAFAGSLV